MATARHTTEFAKRRMTADHPIPFRLLPIAIVVAMCVTVMGLTHARAGLQVVIQTGQDSPDGNGDLTLLNAPTINNAGQLAFVSQLSGTAGGSADNVGMYRRETNGDLALIARRGDTFDGKSIVTFFPAFGYISSNGTVGSVLAFSGGSTAYTFGTGGPLVPMHTTGMPSPSGQSNNLLGVTSAVVNDFGVSAYRAVFNGTQPESGLYQRAADGTHSVRLLGQTSAPRGGTITSPGGFPTLNETNQIGTILTIDTGAPSTIRSAARIDGMTVHELVRQGDLLADGITTVGSFISNSGFINSAGQVALAANLTQPSFGGQGVLLADDNDASVVAKGVLPGSTTAATNIQVVGISDAGRVAFTTDFLGGSDPLSGIYLTGPEGPTKVAFEDTATPVPGKFIRGFLGGGTVLNDAGQMAFIADLSDTINGAAAGRGVFFYGQGGGLQQVARTGDSLLGSTISTVYFIGMVNPTSTVSPDTSMTGLNNLGQVAFSFSLADGTDGMAIWTPTAGLPGDYNNNGVVDAADYVAWRKNDGSQSGYDAWRVNFGATAGSSSSAVANAALPEPTTLFMLIVGMLAMCYRRRATEPQTRSSVTLVNNPPVLKRAAISRNPCV